MIGGRHVFDFLDIVKDIFTNNSWWQLHMITLNRYAFSWKHQGSLTYNVKWGGCLWIYIQSIYQENIHKLCITHGIDGPCLSKAHRLHSSVFSLLLYHLVLYQPVIKSSYGGSFIISDKSAFVWRKQLQRWIFPIAYSLTSCVSETTSIMVPWHLHPIN